MLTAHVDANVRAHWHLLDNGECFFGSAPTHEKYIRKLEDIVVFN